eukprot:TRINITY_DN1422_c0_g2_i2.p5 TRINITY_DN1422_c0_g2~~TRINITY_DN1422_c0_g2_i2.p5  ORF type:complete len:102 (+),score=0.43 TRINITY_DN1422_c0_g2_i2:191-496(+)
MFNGVYYSVQSICMHVGFFWNQPDELVDFRFSFEGDLLFDFSCSMEYEQFFICNLYVCMSDLCDESNQVSQIQSIFLSNTAYQKPGYLRLFVHDNNLHLLF